MWRSCCRLLTESKPELKELFSKAQRSHLTVEGLALFGGEGLTLLGRPSISNHARVEASSSDVAHRCTSNTAALAKQIFTKARHYYVFGCHHRDSVNTLRY